MWPFKKKQPPSPKAGPLAPEAISFSQLDITVHFGDNQRLAPDEWIKTTPLNSMISDPRSAGLPDLHASPEEIFQVASRLSRLREGIAIPGDGVYCAICHIANVELGKLRTPCPKCGRELLKFGWE